MWEGPSCKSSLDLTNTVSTKDPRDPNTYSCLLVALKAQSLKEPGANHKLGEAWSQGDIMEDLVEFTRLMQDQVWLCGVRAQHRDNDRYPSNPHPKATQFSFSLNDSGTT